MMRQDEMGIYLLHLMLVFVSLPAVISHTHTHETVEEKFDETFTGSIIISFYLFIYLR